MMGDVVWEQTDILLTTPVAERELPCQARPKRKSWWCKKASAENIPGFHDSCLFPTRCSCKCHPKEE